MENDGLYRHAHELLARLAEVAGALAANLECSAPLGEAADRHELRELGHELDDAVGTFRALERTAAGEPLSEPQHFVDLARLAGERADLTSRLRHVRRHLDRVMTAAHDDHETSIAAIAQAADLSRETVYQSIARYAMRDLPTTR